MHTLLRMRLARVSLVILSVVVCCEAFLNVHDFSARVKAHRHIPTAKVSKPSTELLFLDLDGWPDEEVALPKKTTSDWDDFTRSREIHRAVAIGICSVAALVWSNPHQGGGGVFDDDVQMALLVVGYLVVGIPHGLLDLHLTPRVLPAREGGPPSFPEWATPYLGVMGLTLLVWLAAPTLALALFLLNTILHFGEGDVAVDNMTARGGAGPGSALLARTEMFARGSYFGAVALHQPAALAADVQGALGGADPSAALPLLAALGAAHYAALLVAGGARLARAADPPVPGGAAPHASVALEMASLSLLHAYAPARVAVFLYLLAFHAPRHVLRAARFSPGLLAEPGRGHRALRYGAVTVATAAAVALLGVGAGWACDLGVGALPATEGGLESPEALLVLRMVIVGTSVMTTPHSVVIFLLGQKEIEEKSGHENEVDTGFF